MSVNIEATTLPGELVRLEPLAEGHVPGLARAAEEDRFAYDYTVVPRAAGMAAYVKTSLARDGLTPFTQIRGMLRNSSPSWAPGEEGKPRDSALFSVIAAEWPQVKATLSARIHSRGPARHGGCTQEVTADASRGRGGSICAS